jgi:N-acetylneuraminic acid mutarotase
MKIKSITLAAFLFLSFQSFAQWVQKANFTGIHRAKSTAFTISNKMYVLGGVDNSGNILNDFWEYDILNNSWLQKPAFPGPERYGAVSFVIGTKAYIATGGNNNGYLDDLWEYNPATGIWAQRAGLPAFSAQHENQRREAWSFVIGNKAYVGGGDGWVFMPNSTNNYAFSDIWEYDPAANQWTQKADMPDFLGRDLSVAGAINNKGYVGLGCDVGQTTNHQTFWEYDPAMNSWTAKAAFPTAYTTDAAAFVLDSGLYVAGGVTLTPVSLTNQFYKYDPVSDTWTQLSAFNGGAIAGAAIVSDGTSAFMGSGYNGNLSIRTDLWEFTNSTTGINDPSYKQLQLSIYPNPAQQQFTIITDRLISSVELLDMAGSSIRTFNGSNKSISISDLSKGAYQVKVVFDDGSMVYKRFIKS